VSFEIVEECGNTIALLNGVCYVGQSVAEVDGLRDLDQVPVLCQFLHQAFEILL
jgi:hypothetical protein